MQRYSESEQAADVHTYRNGSSVTTRERDVVLLEADAFSVLKGEGIGRTVQVKRSRWLNAAVFSQYHVDVGIRFSSLLMRASATC
jgi:hypothetical protein